MAELWIETPLVPSEPLSRAAGRPVWLKMEALQPTGSFKQRGMGAACAKAVQRGARHLVISSGGNAGYAVAWAARRLGVDCTVVVPERSSTRMRDVIAQEEARLVVHGEAWDDAHAHALTLAEGTNVHLVHPFDHEDVWTGNGTLVDEVAKQLPTAPTTMVASIGGGGLMCGLVDGVRRQGWSTEMWGVETEGTASFAATVASGRAERLDRVRGVALTLGARQVCEGLRQRAGAVRSHVVSDREAVSALVRFADDHRVLVEPACGAALAPVYGRRVSGEGPLVVVVCGGASASVEALAEWSTAVGA